MARHLPPLKSLIAFESVVRLGSVTKAADELFVTHGAVSKQIASLETWLGQPLFHKNRKHMQPTAEGQILAKTTDFALGLIADSLSRIESGEAVTKLTVLAPSTFAMRWLIPRVWSFSSQHEQIAVQVRQTDSLESWLDIPFDVAIRTNMQAPAYLTATPFLAEKLILAVSPGSPALASLLQPGDLAKCQVLSATSRPGELEAWLEAAGVPPLRSRVTAFPHFYMALEAALAGLGPLVCPAETLGDLLAKGELVEPWPQLRVPGPTYTAFYEPEAAQARAARTFVDWLVDIRSTPAVP